MRQLPNVLVLSGHDPTGGAGMIADVESIRALGGWPLTVPTALTRQTTRDVVAVEPRPAEEIEATAQVVIDDCPIAAIKVGLIADDASLAAVVALCRAHPELPIVVDPVLKASGGRELSNHALLKAFVRHLLPQATLLTPNLAELARLSQGVGDVLQQAQRLLDAGAEAILVTGTDTPGEAPGEQVTHRLFTSSGAIHEWHWPRLAGEFHGSGCTLAAAIAVQLAKGDELTAACATAQRFSWQALSQALNQGSAQALPDRLWHCAGMNSDRGER
ncbi:bifunctional hydroxymethylpyrimidine kinase/phosphomethylpyrimidine kinase [Kushneria aurantia]|uniref:hydroxymethylpyrimidine kinase n=1 Tax=Kushneria aurantia TaxID=504092 RepID=A0ABV6G113_9GAMM|nr:hydroxymethylpyrimidine/phosphomethylpyrimidine kinase [Kushneria aurantia]